MEMTVREAGRKGGEKTREKYGQEHFATIGKLGGSRVAERGSEFYQEIGRKGGAATAKRGSEYYSAIGKKGGTAPRNSE